MRGVCCTMRVVLPYDKNFLPLLPNLAILPMASLASNVNTWNARCVNLTEQ